MPLIRARVGGGPPGGRARENRKFIQAPSPEIWSETISGGEEILAGKWGGLFLGYLLGKNFRRHDRDHLVQPRSMDAAVCRAEVCYPFRRKHGRHRAVKRRHFITLLGGAAGAWPLAARAQQPVMPVIGFLDIRAPDALMEDRLRAFRQGLKDTGYVERENVAIEYRWAENQVDRLPELAAELVRRQVAVFVTTGGPIALFAAKAATTTIPIVFAMNDDPVKLGLVASLARPGGNLTGVNFLTLELVAKRLELLRELVPAAAHMAMLVSAGSAETTVRDAEPVARALALQLQFFNVSTIREIDAAFATFARERPDALFVAGDPFLAGRRVQLAQLAAFHRLPATYAARDYAEAGGLMSYGPNIKDGFRQIGVHTGPILKSAKPVDLPVVQPNKFELVINAGTARMLGLDVPAMLLARADEVIE